MDLKQKYYTHCREGYFLDKADLVNMENYLLSINFLLPHEYLKSMEVAGMGNMNLVLRVYSSKRSFIVKQARPWVEKFPQIEAPSERSIIEGQFYALIKINKRLGHFFPDLLKIDSNSSVLILEDLGEASDYMDIYNKEVEIETSDIKFLILILSELHKSFNHKTTSERIHNRSMRELNAAHIFDIPFDSNTAPDLDQIQNGLEDIAVQFRNDETMLQKIQALKSVYLADGNYLLMGDFYPGSWLNSSDGIKIIDPEFCFFGPVEFDLGIFAAHLKLSGISNAESKVSDEYYGANEIDQRLMNAFSAIEIMRRILGVAQLPLPHSVEEKKALLEESARILK